jgi:hypothetical protein
VLAQEPRPGTPKQPSEDERHQDRIVELAGDRDEVGDEVEGDGEVHEREPGRELPARRNAPIGEQSLEEDGAVRHHPGDHADVPLAGANRQRGHQRGVHGEENDSSEGNPPHSRAILDG